jgi:hypothetical protein
VHACCRTIQLLCQHGAAAHLHGNLPAAAALVEQLTDVVKVDAGIDEVLALLQIDADVVLMPEQPSKWSLLQMLALEMPGVQRAGQHPPDLHLWAGSSALWQSSLPGYSCQ